MKRRPPRLWVSALIVASAFALSACGSSGSATVAEGRLREARQAGEEAAHERDRVDSLQRQVSKLRHQVRHRPVRRVRAHAVRPAGAAPEEVADEAERSFHVASGNVSCEILAAGATCTVESIGETFSFSEGQSAQAESGSVLPVNLGEVVPYGSTVAVGPISCEIPPTSVPRGVVCGDSTTGHGFEASRVAERQKVY